MVFGPVDVDAHGLRMAFIGEADILSLTESQP